MKIINPNLISLNKKINYSKIKTNAYNLHSETRQWTDPKTLWGERIVSVIQRRWRMNTISF